MQNLTVSLQPYLATCSAVQEILNYAQSKVNQTLTQQQQPEGAVQVILSALHEPEQVNISHYQSVLIYLLGLLSIQKTNTVHSTVVEIVQLLEVSGIGDKHKDEWLTVIEHVQYDDEVVKVIANHAIGDIMIVSDDEVETASKLLCYTQPQTLKVNICRDPRTINSFKDLLKSLSRCDCELQLELHHCFRHPEEQGFPYDELLQDVFSRYLSIFQFFFHLSHQ